MKKVLIFIIFTLFLTNSSYSDLYSVPAKGEANSHGGAIELPESARPNDATISLFEERKKSFIEQRRSGGRLYTVPPKGNAKKFTYEKNISSSKVDKQLSEGYLLSYLFYDNGVIKYDGKAKKGKGKKKKAKKVWDERQYKNLDDSVELGTRNIKMALRRLRKFARTGRDEELDIDDTIRSTAHNGGMLDIKMRPERKNTVKVLLMLDIGGSMDAHVKICEELFSATRTEFKHLESFYFHNFIYESVWKDNRRRMAERLPTFDIFNKYAHDYKVVFVGDATMAPYEITHAGGSVEHWNEEPGATWMERFDSVYDKLIWLNPTPQETWEYSSSVMMTQELVGGRMYPLTVRGLEESMGELSK